jgi:hypothetical protein
MQGGMMKLRITLLIGLVLLFSLAACNAGKKAAADAAMKAADAATAPIMAEAMKYVPDQAKALQDSMATAKDDFDKGDYEGALAAVKDVPGKAKDLSDAVKAKKDEITAKFNDMKNQFPGMMAAVSAKVAQLKKIHKLPTGADAGVADMKSNWDAATSAFGSGDLSDAAAKCAAAKQKLDEVKAMLGMKS